MTRMLLIITVVILSGLTTIGPDWQIYAQADPTTGDYSQKQYRYGRGEFELTQEDDGDPEVMKNQRKHMNMSVSTVPEQGNDELELEIDEYGDPQYLQWGLWGEPWELRPWD